MQDRCFFVLHKDRTNSHLYILESATFVLILHERDRQKQRKTQRDLGVRLEFFRVLSLYSLMFFLYSNFFLIVLKSIDYRQFFWKLSDKSHFRFIVDLFESISFHYL